jgi:hypothetical protein
MDLWNTLLLVYHEIDVRYRCSMRFPKHFRHTLSGAEIRDGIDSFKQLPALVEGLSGGEAGIRQEIIRINRPITKVSQNGKRSFWLAPLDVWPEIYAHAHARRVRQDG